MADPRKSPPWGSAQSLNALRCHRMKHSRNLLETPAKTHQYARADPLLYLSAQILLQTLNPGSCQKELRPPPSVAQSSKILMKLQLKC